MVKLATEILCGLPDKYICIFKFSRCNFSSQNPFGELLV